MESPQKAKSISSARFPTRLINPISKLPQPSACNKNTRNNVDKSHEKSQETSTLLIDDQQDRFNVVFEENAGNVVFWNDVALFGDGVLVCPDGTAVRTLGIWVHVGKNAVWREFKMVNIGGVNGRDDVTIILEFVEVILGGSQCAIKWVD